MPRTQKNAVIRRALVTLEKLVFPWLHPDLQSAELRSRGGESTHCPFRYVGTVVPLWHGKECQENASCKTPTQAVFHSLLEMVSIEHKLTLHAEVVKEG